MNEPSNIKALLSVLARHGVDFIVVGGVAAVANGAPVNTFDVDIVHLRTPENIERLLAALRELDAVYRTDPRRLTPGASNLAGDGHQLLKTKYGVLDVLSTIEETSTYEDLRSETVLIELEGIRARVLTLERLIRVKEKLDRPKDKAMLLVLRATLEERNRRG